MITKRANQLHLGDTIVAPDGSRHTVTAIDWHGLAGAWLSIHTDTGLRLDKDQNTASLHTYDVAQKTCRELGEIACGTHQCVCDVSAI